MKEHITIIYDKLNFYVLIHKHIQIGCVQLFFLNKKIIYLYKHLNSRLLEIVSFKNFRKEYKLQDLLFFE